MTQRASAYDLKLLVDRAMKSRRGPRATLYQRHADERLAAWLVEHPDHQATYVQYAIGPTRRRWLAAFMQRMSHDLTHSGDDQGPPDRTQ
jgi:hypothetical protein